MAARDGNEGQAMEIAENPDITYPDAHLYCDRDGVLEMGTGVPDLMLPIACAPWLRLSLAATGLALRTPNGAEWVVPGVPEAREDAGAAMDAIWAFRERLLAALRRPATTRRNALCPGRVTGLPTHP